MAVKISIQYNLILCIKILFSCVIDQNAPDNLPYQENDALF